jgi:hypothetical protein
MSLRPRLGAAVATVVVLALGLGARKLLVGWPAKVAGVALYATMVYALILVFAPRLRVGRALALCVGLCFAIELLQLTPGPAYLAGRHVLFRLALGATFSAWDLPMYVGGALLGAAAHAAVTRARR